eukprot:TRINITY_DN48984_c0_g1_i1.p1 TRINITY_DN48984_c0_g1~~TRINITY_DN48984_c0_g1_i1.p1  ORF type:complete len:684 (-),score=57.35 TRINITY_DN48984_c0_g1_i1:72-2123(-)
MASWYNLGDVRPSLVCGKQARDEDGMVTKVTPFQWGDEMPMVSNEICKAGSSDKLQCVAVGGEVDREGQHISDSWLSDIGIMADASRDVGSRAAAKQTVRNGEDEYIHMSGAKVHDVEARHCGGTVMEMTSQAKKQQTSYYSAAMKSGRSSQSTPLKGSIQGTSFYGVASATPSVRTNASLSSDSYPCGSSATAFKQQETVTHSKEIQCFTLATSVKHDFPASRPPLGRYRYISEAAVDIAWESARLPTMSCTGGTEEEFERYWAANRQPQTLLGGWVERVSHPQVNTERYWYLAKTHQFVWDHPGTSTSAGEHHLEPETPSCNKAGHAQTRSGPAWDLTVGELKAVLYSGQAEDYGLRAEQLAERACTEYEQFQPKVLSWHDFQHITFWFFGGMYKQNKGQDDTKSFFGANKSAGRDLFADDAFFLAAEKRILTRIHLMHPINLTYFLWSYSRAGIRVPDLMKKAGDHLCEGLIPMLDRCSLGTMLWNFYKQEVRHDQFFEDAAVELSRPNRLRSFAPRNYQNSMIAFSRCRHWNARVIDALARGMTRLLETHDPAYPKHVRSVLFPYFCRDGSEVTADSFRIAGLAVLAKAFHEIGGHALPHMERCLSSILDYTLRSVERSPPMMREPGDFCAVVNQLALSAESGLPALATRLCALDVELVARGASEASVRTMKEAIRRLG